jgi:hypothetical protein
MTRAMEILQSCDKTELALLLFSFAGLAIGATGLAVVVS